MNILKKDIDVTNPFIKDTLYETYATTNVGLDNESVKMNLK